MRRPSLDVRSWRRLVGKSQANTPPTPELDKACADGVAESRKRLTTDLLRRCPGAQCFQSKCKCEAGRLRVLAPREEAEVNFCHILNRSCKDYVLIMNFSQD